MEGLLEHSVDVGEVAHLVDGGAGHEHEPHSAQLGAGAHRRRQLPPVQARHDKVEHDHVRRAADRQTLQRAGTVAGMRHLVSFRLQEFHQVLAERLVVIDDEDSEGMAAHSGPFISAPPRGRNAPAVARPRPAPGRTAPPSARLKYPTPPGVREHMLAFLLWVVLLLLCWPLALLALVLFPLVWLLLLPFRILGIAVDGVLGLLKAILFLPARVLGGPAALRR